MSDALPTYNEFSATGCHQPYLSAAGSICGDSDSAHTNESPVNELTRQNSTGDLEHVSHEAPSYTPPSGDDYNLYYASAVPSSYTNYGGYQPGDAYNYDASANATPTYVPAVHWPLINKMGYLWLPSHKEVRAQQYGSNLVTTNNNNATNDSSWVLFVGQVDRRVTHAQLHWLLFHASGANICRISQRGPGCFVVNAASQGDFEALCCLHGRLLCDNSGAWFAGSSDDVETLYNYLSDEHRPRSRFLPSKAIVIEKASQRNRGRPSHLVGCQ